MLTASPNKIYVSWVVKYFNAKNDNSASFDVTAKLNIVTIGKLARN